MADPPPARLAVWSSLGPTDRWLFALRAAALLGGSAWGAIHPLHHPFDVEAHRQVLYLFAAFTVYSALLYLASALSPGRLPLVYRAAMVLDLAFIFALVRVTGGMTSDFYLAFYLLIALHAFYFGLATGALTALLAALLYLLADAWPPPISPSDLGLRIGFFFLVGVCMGGLAERERRERRLVERLDRDLRHQQERLREAQDQLIRSDRLATVGELAAGLAHDLRNPLAGIAGALRVLTGQLPQADPRKTVLEEIQEQVTRMNKTLTDLLWHSRPPEPRRLALNVNDLVEQSVRFLPMSPGTGIRIVKNLQADLPPLSLDPNLFHQALVNILLNARQVMPDGGSLTVATRCRPDSPLGADLVEVAISDTGPGIPAEHLSRIFQPFFTTKSDGTGLGLTIATRIVEQHGGRIVAENGPERGATIRILLPVPATDPARSETDGAEAARR